jgi:hypothetical protein
MYDDILGKKVEIDFDETIKELRDNAFDETTKLAVFLQKEFGRYLKDETPVDNAIRLLKRSIDYEKIICAECKQKGE